MPRVELTTPGADDESEFIAAMAASADMHRPWLFPPTTPEAYREYLDEAQRFCTSRQVSYFRADVNIPFDELILRVFRRGGFLR
mgnify:CR=1 FL=1